MKNTHYSLAALGSLEKTDHYLRWRDQKLAAYPLVPEDLFTVIEDADKPQPAELQRITTVADIYNLTLYRFSRPPSGKMAVHSLAQALGLLRIDANWCADADSLTSIQIAQHAGQHDYIPYTDKKLSWHTDGYYNPPTQQINGMLLHCVRPASTGGESRLMDHEIAYILLREANPAYIRALMHPAAFTIPANSLKGVVIRPAQTGPVFSIHPDGRLHMRYSARQRNVIWRDDPATQAAAQFLLDLWEQDSPYKLRYTLQAGEGLLCNNVLHCRTEFVDHAEADRKRLLYRGRYLDRLHTRSINPHITGQDHA